MNIRKDLSDSDLKQFDNLDELTDDYFIFNLGVGLQYEYSPPGIRYSAPYVEMGEKLWGAFKYELYDLLCNSERKEPKDWLNETVTGDIRNLATGIISAITAKYNVSIAIALPAAALIVKKGLLNYCSTLSQILLSKKSVYEKKDIVMKSLKKSKKSKAKTEKKLPVLIEIKLKTCIINC
jgi:hypothetical protein